MRMLPPMSEPMPSTAPSAASRAPSPPEEPPAVCATDHGLHVRPQSGLLDSNASSVCGTFVLAMMIAPAARSVSTTYGGRKMCAWAPEIGSRWERKTIKKTYGCVALGWFVGPLRVSDRAVKPLYVNYPRVSSVPQHGQT